MAERVVYLNGTFVPESEAKLSIYDLSVMQAAAAFEMTRSFTPALGMGQHFKLREHIARLGNSCNLLGIPLPEPLDKIEWLCHDVSVRNPHGPGEEHRLLIVVSPGCAPMYRGLEGVIPHPFVYIADFPLRYTVQGFSRYFLEGVHCVTSKVQQVPNACVPSAAKHRSRLHFHLAQQQAPAGTWPILLLPHPDLPQSSYMVTEAPGANLCYVEHGQVRLIDTQALPGISMATVETLCHSERASWTGLSRLRSADEVWLTGTPFCLLPVVSIDGKPIGDGTIGPVYKDTLAKWSQLVGVDIQQQILCWDQQNQFQAMADVLPKLWTPDAQRAHTT